ncbi:hypothetical protein OBBRIDRAFT_320532 [Obba rivulosa]|uniref:Uncharacterized protein n=1 Tax=Obba rivulosa TaxID=1052685 RepID=A0A8E2ARG9_9APHY|nr:hypothetical protein OBBRIDRAFT_320532 [Obba rivulosa]
MHPPYHPSQHSRPNGPSGPSPYSQFEPSPSPTHGQTPLPPTFPNLTGLPGSHSRSGFSMPPSPLIIPDDPSMSMYQSPSTYSPSSPTTPLSRSNSVPPQPRFPEIPSSLGRRSRNATQSTSRSSSSHGARVRGSSSRASRSRVSSHSDRPVSAANADPHSDTHHAVNPPLPPLPQLPPEVSQLARAVNAGPLSSFAQALEGIHGWLGHLAAHSSTASDEHERLKQLVESALECTTSDLRSKVSSHDQEAR